MNALPVAGRTLVAAGVGALFGDVEVCVVVGIGAISCVALDIFCNIQDRGTEQSVFDFIAETLKNVRPMSKELAAIGMITTPLCAAVAAIIWLAVELL